MPISPRYASDPALLPPPTSGARFPGLAPGSRLGGPALPLGMRPNPAATLPQPAVAAPATVAGVQATQQAAAGQQGQPPPAVMAPPPPPVSPGLAKPAQAPLEARDQGRRVANALAFLSRTWFHTKSSAQAVVALPGSSGPLTLLPALPAGGSRTLARPVGFPFGWNPPGVAKHAVDGPVPVPTGPAPAPNYAAPTPEVMMNAQLAGQMAPPPGVDPATGQPVAVDPATGQPVPPPGAPPGPPPGPPPPPTPIDPTTGQPQPPPPDMNPDAPFPQPMPVDPSVPPPAVDPGTGASLATPHGDARAVINSQGPGPVEQLAQSKNVAEEAPGNLAMDAQAIANSPDTGKMALDTLVRALSHLEKVAQPPADPNLLFDAIKPVLAAHPELLRENYPPPPMAAAEVVGGLAGHTLGSGLLGGIIGG